MFLLLTIVVHLVSSGLQVVISVTQPLFIFLICMRIASEASEVIRMAGKSTIENLTLIFLFSKNIFFLKHHGDL